MPRQSRRDQPSSSKAPDHDSVHGMTNTTEQQPIMTPGTTAPSSEADVTDTTSIYLERLAADYAKLAVRKAETRSELDDILNRA
ncbi:hypothetical protein LTR48_000542 [Friedmanniomyces endolithicus]|uniref:Uncharacterized protein n=1 Tax=Rachicladosporium monterosium TaxID=1507873 RepID=A0ABR0L1Z3_9PEZI|nr:hypothetical protein LTR29_011717 [Friedmanniomyces endolithicus]KAK1094343.1 hypothetical protein LTR48_000542 [Friedmanniomyces endolithicus]KAK5142253.1 hypothetical protein LTR32_005365 [Rachicladosporium monterosium]